MLRKSSRPLCKTSSQKNLDLHVLANSATTPQPKGNEMLSHCRVLKQCPGRWERLPTAGRTAVLTIATLLFIIWSTCIKGSADTQAKPGAAFEPEEEAENSHERVNEKLPITGQASIISTIFFSPFHPSKRRGENEFRQCLRQSGDPACHFLKWFGCFFFCWVTPPQVEMERRGSLKNWA